MSSYCASKSAGDRLFESMKIELNAIRHLYMQYGSTELDNELECVVIKYSKYVF